MIYSYYGFYDDWSGHKVAFDPFERLIIISPGVTAIDVGVEVYSDWKEWVMLRDNSKYPQAMRAVGGDLLPGDKRLGSTFFLMNGWRIFIGHNVQFNGNLYTEEGDFPIITSSSVRLSISSVSNLVDRVDVESTDLGALPVEVADAVTDHVNTLTVGKFIALK